MSRQRSARGGWPPFPPVQERFGITVPRRLCLVLLIFTAIVLLSTVLILACSPSSATITGDSPPSSGDWVVQNPTKVVDEVVELDGGIVVRSTLELWGTTVLLDSPEDGRYLVNVTPQGKLLANDSRIASSTEHRIGFQVHGEMTLKRVKVEDCYDGLRILTDKAVLIENTSILDPLLKALHLEGANRTTVRDVVIQAEGYDCMPNATVDARDPDQTYTPRLLGCSIVSISDGKATIRNLNISMIGTAYFNLTINKHGSGAEVDAEFEWPLVEIDTKDAVDISGIRLHEALLTFNATTNIHNMVAGGSAEVSFRFATTVVVVSNYRNVTLGGLDIGNLASRFEIDIVRTGGSFRLVADETESTSLVVRAFVDETFQTAGPHDFLLALRGVKCEDIPILDSNFMPGYAGSKTPTFRTEVVVDSVIASNGTDLIDVLISPVFDELKNITSTVRISNSTFKDVFGNLARIDHKPGPSTSTPVRTLELNETIIVENCTFQDCYPDASTAKSNVGIVLIPVSISEERVNVYERRATVRNNVFHNNVGILLRIGGHLNTVLGTERTEIVNNTFSSNPWGTPLNNRIDHFIYLEHRDSVTLRGNRFLDNVCEAGILLLDYGGDAKGRDPADLLVTGNTFARNVVFELNLTKTGFIEATWGGHLEVSHNNITEMDIPFLNVTEYPMYALFSTLDFINNSLSDNNETIVLFYNADSMHSRLTVNIANNTAWNNSGPIVDYNRLATEVTEQDFDATISFSNNTVDRSSSVVLRCYGNITVNDNVFRDCPGYVLRLEQLQMHQPVISDNVFLRCGDVMWIGAKLKAPYRVVLSMRDLEINCTGNALGFYKMEVTMWRVDISSSADPAIIVEHGTVDAYDCQIEIGSGNAMWNGSIYVWFHVEARVEWANAELVPSGNPVVGATVSFYNQSGSWSASETTRVDGRTDSVALLQWSLERTTLGVSTPYDVHAEKSTITTQKEIELNRSYVGDDALHLILVDHWEPLLYVHLPTEGEFINTTYIEVEGVVVDVGSGLWSVEVALGGGEYAPADLSYDGRFNLTLKDVQEGLLDIHVRVFDTALNQNITTISVLVDYTPPMLVIHEPLDNTTTNQQNINIRGEYEPGATITIGLRVLQDGPGVLDEEYVLWEGLNVITIEATDKVGNTVAVVLHVVLDTIPPTLVVVKPLDGLVTTSADLVVSGRAGGFDWLRVDVFRTSTDIINESIDAGPDGSFNHTVRLDEGENVIVVEARDRAGNRVSARRTVTLDSTAPRAEITYPFEGFVTNQREIRVRGTLDLEAIAYLDGKRIANNGTLDRVVGLEEGRNLIELVVEDEIGNTRRYTVNVTLDTVRPELVVTQPSGGFLRTNDVDVLVMGSVGDDVIEVTVLGQLAELTGNTFSITVRLPHDGLHEFAVVATDLAGNTASETVTVDLSRAPPSIFLEFAPSSSLVYGPNATLRINGAINVPTNQVVIVQQTEAGERRKTLDLDGDTSFSIDIELAEGLNSISVEALDAYGNSNTTATYTVTFEPEPKEEDVIRIGVGQLGIVLLIIAVASLAAVLYLRHRFKSRLGK